MNVRRIESIWAYLAVDADGSEEPITIHQGEVMAPAIGADETRVKALRPVIDAYMRETGTAVRLVRFDRYHTREL